MGDEPGKGPFLGLPATAWKRLDPAGIVVVALFLGIPGLIWAGVPPIASAATSSGLGLLYFGWRFLEQWIGLKRDKTRQEREALKVVSDLTMKTIKGQPPSTSGKKR